ncbi:F-box protein CPR1 [Lathyrus oleraceus]|uniref:F-box protein CPR1 n=1 Tax=Pisum sativum TaxID=3888 RepID=UPI0021CE7EBC|nr:F-box protein CPR1-like [Pisum sativum]
MINYINDDVALSILSKLSFKSLKRFGCVRKSWFLLSDNPNFMSMYRHNFFSKYSYDDDTSLVLHIHGHKKLYSFSGEDFENMVELDWPNQIDHLIFLGFGCLNGILCFLDPIWNKIVLWNPTTNELKVIRPSPFESFSAPGALNFDATVSFSTIPNLHGFGYDCVGDDYKFIRNTPIKPKFHTFSPSYRDLKLARDKSLKPFWEIYSLKNNSWKKLEINMPTCSKHNSGFGTFRVYLRGVCHWLNLDGENNYIGASLISFDLSNEMYISTPVPSFAGEHCTGLSVLNDSIALFTYHENMRTFEISTFEISLLGEIGVKESWYKLFTIGPLPWFKSPIGMGKKGEIFFRKKDSELVWFDLNTNTVKHLGFKAVRVTHRVNPGCRIKVILMLNVGYSNGITLSATVIYVIWFQELRAMSHILAILLHVVEYRGEQIGGLEDLREPYMFLQIGTASESVNAAYIFSRKDLSRPAIQIPCASKAVVAVRAHSLCFREFDLLDVAVRIGDQGDIDVEIESFTINDQNENESCIRNDHNEGIWINPTVRVVKRKVEHIPTKKRKRRY